MRDDEGGVGFVVVDEVHEATVVGLDVGLASAHLLSFEPEFAHVEGDLALLLEGVFGLGVLPDEDSDDAECAGGFDGIEVSDTLGVRRDGLKTTRSVTGYAEVDAMRWVWVCQPVSVAESDSRGCVSRSVRLDGYRLDRLRRGEGLVDAFLYSFYYVADTLAEKEGECAECEESQWLQIERGHVGEIRAR